MLVGGFLANTWNDTGGFGSYVRQNAITVGRVPMGATVLDLACGYGEFINTVRCRQKFGMDLNPDSPRFLDPIDAASDRK